MHERWNWVTNGAVAVAVLATSAPISLDAQPRRVDAHALRAAYDTHRPCSNRRRMRALVASRSGPTNISGRATDIAVADRGGSRRIYAAYATSGVWKTDDNGASWQAIFENQPSTSIGDVAVAPSNPDVALGRHRRVQHLSRLDAWRRHLQVRPTPAARFSPARR